MDNPIANPADLADTKVIGRWAECYRRLREGGLSPDDFQVPIAAIIGHIIINTWLGIREAGLIITG